MGGKLGNSFDAQRLIWHSRNQGKEAACIEAIYKANHEEGKCLGDLDVLIAAAEVSGVTGSREMLKSKVKANSIIVTMILLKSLFFQCRKGLQRFWKRFKTIISNY